MSSSLINWLLNYPKRLFFLVLIVTIFAGCFIYKNISINTSNTDLLSKELTFRKNQIEFKKDFLGEIPIDPEVGKQGDLGIPIVESNPDHLISKIYLELANRIKLKYS